MNVINIASLPCISLTDLTATQNFAAMLAKNLVVGDVVLLKGAMGAGKTACAREIIHSLASDKPEVTSPTYTLMQSYDVILENITVTCWHIDLYRLDNARDILELGIEEMMLSGLLLIEWPERLEESLPLDYILCEFSVAPDGRERMVALSFAGATSARRATILQQALSLTKA